MNTDRLQHLLSILEEVERKSLHFNMNQWFDHKCNSAGCAIGYAASDPKFQAEGLTPLTRDNLPTTSISEAFEIYHAGHMSYKAVSLFFDIPLDTTFHLFCPDTYYEEPVCPHHVMERIKTYLTEHKNKTALKSFLKPKGSFS